jgi:hypothetical protein
MKKSFFILALLCVITLMSACQKEPSITQGVYGTVIERYGDWMPGSTADHGERPITCDVYVYEYTMLSDFNDSVSAPNSIDAMPKQLVAKTTSDSKGFYEIYLAPGTYSIFLLDDGKLHANGCDDYGGINPITINSNEKLERQLVLDHAVY